MDYSPITLPFKHRQISDDTYVAVSGSGDHVFLTPHELGVVTTAPASLPLERQAELRARFFLGTAGPNSGTRRLMNSRRAAKRETVESGPSLHAIVPTLQCAHSCGYCQVSRSLSDEGHSMSRDDLGQVCDTIFQSPAKTLTVEFQGGDPLLRFDLVQYAILRIKDRNEAEGRNLRFVVASTLHQLTDEMCDFFQAHNVFLSTSIDGPRALHNRNRALPTRDAYERTVVGIEMARRYLGHDAVSALMTTTRASLEQPEAIVDEYVRLGFRDVFLRPLSLYGFAKRNQARLGYSLEEFAEFYLRGLERVLHWNREGVEIREVYASIVLNKILSTFDGGFVDLQSPTGAGLSAVVYNYDGFVYPSDEARMLAETGDTSLRLGRIGERLEDLLDSPVERDLIQASLTDETPGCKDCAYSLFCAPNPIDAQAQFGTPFAAVELTEHCRRHMWLFDTMFRQVRDADEWLTDLYYQWAMPVAQGCESCDV